MSQTAYFSLCCNSGSCDQRARFLTEAQPARLEIRPVIFSDAGVFRCRVDYKVRLASDCVGPQLTIANFFPG